MIRLTVAALLLPIAVPAVAQEGMATAPTISPDTQGELEARFAGMDGDGDGSVSKGEFIAAAAEGMRRLTRNGGTAAGPNGTPKLSAEAASAVERLFTQLDEDGNGVLSLAEVRSGRNRLRVE